MRHPRSAQALRATTEQVVQRAAVYLLMVAAGLASLATLASCAGLIPWLTLTAGWNGTPLPWAGAALQTGLTALLVLVALTLPTALRVLALERSHRDFSITMSDVAEAYHICHAADRKGVFQLGREYDAVRERIEHLRQHPALQSLEPCVLTAAAQMSTAARDLAQTYSDEALARAQAFLQERQQEMNRFRSRIDTVTDHTNDLRRLLDSVELEESIAESQLRQIEEQLGDTMQTLARLKSARPKVNKAGQRPDLHILRPAAE